MGEKSLVPKTFVMWPTLSRFVLVSLLGLLVFLACPPRRPSLALSDNYQEMFDVNLFHERVKLLNSVSHGATQEDILKTLGEPQDREATPDGSRIFIYRVRCYMGPEPFSRWPRHLSATYKVRITFDQQKRVSAIQSKP